MHRKIQKLLPPLLVVVVVIAAGTLLFRRWGDVLFRMQELSLFLPTRLFYQTSCIYPGGTLTWMAAYMTQFFYHPMAGVALLSLVWLVIIILLCRLYKLSGSWILFSILVPMMLLVALVQTGYWMYYIKLQGHTWVPTLAVLMALLLQIPAFFTKGWWRSLYILIVAATSYPLMGAWSFLAVALLCLRRYDDAERRHHITYILLGVAVCAIVPQVCYQWVYVQTMRECLYTAAMPTFAMSSTDFQEFRHAYYALALSFVPILASLWMKNARQAYVWICAIVLVGISVWGVHSKWYMDTNYLKEARMMTLIEKQDWQGVLSVMKDNNIGETMPPTRLMVMEKNLALFRLGRAGDDMFSYPEGAEQYCLCGRHCVVVANDKNDSITHVPKGSKHKHAVLPVRITQTGGKMLYYNYGKEQFCYRWCMEDGVEFGWTVHDLKYMTKASLVAEEWEVARKYLDLLAMTKYHREWADKYRKFLYRPELMSADEEFRPIIPMSVFTDRLDGDKTMVELYLLRTFSAGQGADVYYQEMTLICAMLMKDIELFWPRFRQFISMHKDEDGFRVPRHYQEAAYLYTMLEPQKESVLWPGMTNAEASVRIPFDNEVKRCYDEFMQFNRQCGPMSDEQKKVAFRPQFGDTFYYFYFLVRNQKTN